MSEINAETSGDNSNDLTDLLKSALDDFDKPLSSSTNKTQITGKEVIKNPLDINLREDFEKKFEELLLNDVVEDGTLSSNISDLLNVVQNEIKVQTNQNSDNDAVNQAINSLDNNIEEIKESMNGDSLKNNFNFNNLKNDNIFPVMEQMFQMLMSKEILYPSLIAIKDRYPIWLQDNKDNIDAAEAARYKKQHEVIQKICLIFECEDESDSEDIKQNRFVELLRLFQEMTDLGQPPKDFGDALPSVHMNDDMFNLSSSDVDPNTCNTM